MTKLVVVTGANRGIGLAISKQLLTKTADTNVVLAGRDEAGLQAAKESIVKECKVAESRMKVVRMDVADDASVAAAYKQISSIFPGEKLYALVNNAGVGPDLSWMPGPYAPDTARKTLDVNVRGPLRCVRTFLPMFKDGTRVVSLSSAGSHQHVDRLGPVMRAKLLSDMPIEDC
eukprot:GHVU01070014.1.p1 GENE.GHVU01070014.1~~GHVU01070014.1.p1  ORF type:complete len:174 (-),score=20.49 GHVU01070014.1:12-533(-)